ncbi:succinylglutamate desuccinylase/aspartoacylase family protein [Polymorphobacter sp.]|uniref:succinylglutamate desuccinylase/aspartoacylase family protein n=1 Tax=Polymorphobacter sp. TaxID=1909290 RepID=UPI003F7279A1
MRPMLLAVLRPLLLAPLLIAPLLTSQARAATETVGSLDGIPVIDRLDVADQPSGRTSRFWFRAGDTATAQRWLVPVIVVKGARPGPRLLVTAGAHGDELNGIDVIHRLVASLDPAGLAGTVIAVPGLNPPGLLQSTREFTATGSHNSPNLNREMPGSLDGSAVAHHAALLWQNLMRPNADLAVDLHTQSRGTAYVMYVFASNARTRRMAELMLPDAIKLDRGDKGTIENTLTDDGVPAITLELGHPERFDAAMISRGVAGLQNLMREQKMLAGTVIEPTATVTGNALASVRAPRGGWARLVVPLGSRVEQGQPVASISDAFGRTTDTLVAPQAGIISSSVTDPRVERGSTLVRILYSSPDPACAYGCP